MISKDDSLRAFELGRRMGSSFTACFPGRTASGSAGERLGTAAGTSIEFHDFRDYQPGDDIRRLDWAAYARSDRLTIRLYREEVQPRADIVSDLSSSMAAPDQKKALASLVLAGLLMEAAFRAGMSVAWHGYGAGWSRLFGSSNSFPGCEIPDFAGAGGLEDELVARGANLSFRGIRFCISDFLWQSAPESVMRRVVEGASAAVFINVLCAEEMDPPEYGPVSLLDSESGHKLDLKIGPGEKKVYLENLGTHFDLWKDAAVSYGALFCQVRAEDILDENSSALVQAGILEYSS
jgi:hypothetical protein